MSDWNLPWDGGCRCGRIRVQLSAPPLLASACHCSGCQRMSASAFSLTLSAPRSGFAVLAGEPIVGGLHGATRHHFCSYCLSWVFTEPAGMDEFVNVRASVLDDHGWFAPFAEFWTREKLSWASTPAVRSFETQPEPQAFGALIEAFAAEGARPG